MSFVLTLHDGVRWHREPVHGRQRSSLLHALVEAATTGDAGWSENALIEWIWGSDRPENPSKALQVLVSRTRSATDPRLVVRTVDGYRLGLARHEVDLLAQQDLQQAAADAYRDGELRTALDLARQALAIGPSGVATRTLALSASDAGEHETAFPLLERLTAEQEDDQELRCRLLSSEAALRGTASALDSYQRYRADLADRLGAEPGPGLQQVHRTLLASDRPIHKGLRYDSTALLGRDEDSRALRSMLGTARVVSIVGAGGLGKTRLGQLMARRASQPTVYVAELVGVRSGVDVLGEIGSILGIRDSMSTLRDLTPKQHTDLRGRIAQQLDSAPTLLVLDNCEHVLDAVADLVGFLIATTSQLSVLTTSRAPLSIPAEQVYRLGELSAADARELFRQRATAVRPEVRLDDAAVDEVVARLDGLPLAIELAAAKTRVLSVQHIARLLDDRFGLLRGGDRSAPDRHRTLLAVIDWSWHLLSDVQGRALMRLSLFADGFTVETARAVLGWSEQQAMDVIEALSEQSLVSVVEDGTGVRYRMLETVREFGHLRLTEAGEQAEAERALRAWAREYAHTQLFGLSGPDQFDAMDAVRAEEGNLSDVLRRALSVQDRPTAIVMLGTLCSYWSMLGEHIRVTQYFDAAEEMVAGWTPPTEVADNARVALSQLLLTATIMLPRRSSELRELLRQLGGTATRPAWSGAVQATLVWNPERRRGPGKQLDELCAHGDRYPALLALYLRAQVRENDGDLTGAIADVTAALDRTDPDDGPWQGAMLHALLSWLYGQLGRHPIAADHARIALPVLDRLDTDDADQCRWTIALREMQDGRFERAERLVEEQERAQRRRPALATSSGAAVARAELAFCRGDQPTGLSQMRRAVELAEELPLPGRSDPDDPGPVTLFTRSAYLSAAARHGDVGSNGYFVEVHRRLRRQLRVVLSADRDYLDVPVIGTAAFAFGLSALLRGLLDVRDSLWLLVLADRLSYNQILPSMAWQHAVYAAERVAPGQWDQIHAECAERAPSELVADVRALVNRFVG